MAKPNAQVVKLPVTGYFASDYRGRKVRHQIPKHPGITINDLVQNQFRTEPPRVLKNVLVEVLDSVRKHGIPYGSTFVADKWLEAEGMIEAVEFRVDGSVFGDVIFRVTEKGEAFLREHEAPEHWA